MALSDTLYKLSIDLLAKYGQAATFNRDTVSTYDPAESSITVVSTLVYTANVYPSAYLKSDVDGVTVLTDDTRLIVAPGTEPEINDKVIFNSTTYRILNVQRISIQGSNVIYICQVRL